MNFKTVRISDVLRRFADMLDDPVQWAKIREHDIGFIKINQLLRFLRLFCRLATGVDLMPGAVKAKGEELLIINQPNKFQLPFQSREGK